MATKETPKDKDKVKKTDRDLDLANSVRGVWLVKVPKYISDRWEKAAANTEVGKLRIRKVNGAKPEVNFTLSDAVCAPLAGLSDMDKLDLVRNSSTYQQIPKEHKFKVSSIAAQTLGVFSHNIGDPENPAVVDKLSVEGKVVQRAECCPNNGSLYASIKKEALTKAGEPRRMVKQLDKHVTTSFKPVANHATNLAHERAKKLEGKKMRDDKDKVQEILFALFEKHQFYNIKDLAQETRQPMAYLKQILKEHCNYSVKPPHRNMWEPEGEDDEEAAKKKKRNESSSDSD
eukprot:GFUD01065756.1.p1 GENE.GFUD01065756.1~~GFUD01065756.1.p1  ORF type:complete len:288 (+),score=112.53 GFUD01065756.1:128-991(+)